MGKLEVRNVEIISYNIEEVYSIIDKAKKNNIDYYYIYHNLDVNDDGTLKKPHYHIQLYCDNQRTIENWVKFYAVDPNRVEKIKNKISAIRYLIHCDNNEKYQYQLEDICSNGEIIKYFKSTISSENNEIELIYLHITKLKRHIGYKELWDFVIDNGIWSTYRRNYSIIKDLLYDHNLLFTNTKI